MEHKEYVRLVSGADSAVLFLHGILGTPNHFVTQIPLVDLVPESMSVCNVLLPGHGGKVEEFSRSSMKEWKDYVWSVFAKLSHTHDRVILVGHSMGTLFAMQLALEHPQKVPFLFLIAAPMRPWLRLYGIVNCLRLVFGRVREDKPFEVATRNVCGVVTTRKLWKYIGWIPRFLELFIEIYRTEKVMGKLTVPCVAWQSEKDELVSNFSRRVLEKSGVVEVHNLLKSSHFYYYPEDAETVRTDFVKRIQNRTG